jgi:hypothetical protein
LLFCSISAPGLSTKCCVPSAMNSSSCPSLPEDHRRPLSLSTRYLLRTLLDHHRRTTVFSDDPAGPGIAGGNSFPSYRSGGSPSGSCLTVAGITATAGAHQRRSGERCRRPCDSRVRVQPADRAIRASTGLWRATRWMAGRLLRRLRARAAVGNEAHLGRRGLPGTHAGVSRGVQEPAVHRYRAGCWCVCQIRPNSAGGLVCV